MFNVIHGEKDVVADAGERNARKKPRTNILSMLLCVVCCAFVVFKTRSILSLVSSNDFLARLIFSISLR